MWNKLKNWIHNGNEVSKLARESVSQELMITEQEKILDADAKLIGDVEQKNQYLIAEIGRLNHKLIISRLAFDEMKKKVDRRQLTEDEEGSGVDDNDIEHRWGEPKESVKGALNELRMLGFLRESKENPKSDKPSEGTPKEPPRVDKIDLTDAKIEIDEIEKGMQRGRNE